MDTGPLRRSCQTQKGSTMSARVVLAFHLFLSFAAYAAAQTPGGAATPTAGAKDEQEIRKVLADFVDAWNRHDAKAFSMVFAEDADFTNVRGTSATSRAE